MGNLLARDDGVGIHVIRQLQKRALPDGVSLLEAGVAGHELLADLAEVDRLIVIDCMEGGDECSPGEIFRFTADDLPSRRDSKMSLHEMSLIEVLSIARVLGTLPDTVVFGIQAADVTPWSEELSTEVAAAIPRAIELVEAEIERAPQPASGS